MLAQCRSRSARRDSRLRRRTWQMESLESRVLLTSDLLISEFMASNSTKLFDEDGESSDWIEIFNSGTSSVNLDGYTLTDNATNDR